MIFMFHRAGGNEYEHYFSCPDSKAQAFEKGER